MGKGIYKQKTHTKQKTLIIFKGKRIKTFPIKSGGEQGSPLYHYYSSVSGSFGQSNKTRKINKNIQTGK